MRCNLGFSCHAAIAAACCLVLAGNVQAQRGGSGFSGGFGGGGGGMGSGFGSSRGGSISGGFRPSPGATGLRSNRNSMDPFSSTRSDPRFGQSGGFNQGSNSFGSFSGGLTGGGNFGGRNNMGMNQFGGMSNRGTRMAPYSYRAYATVPPATLEIQPRLEGILTSATGSQGNRDIRLESDGSTLVLRGSVSNQREKQLAEAMVRLEPGVYEVRNEIQVVASSQKPPPQSPTRNSR